VGCKTSISAKRRQALPAKAPDSIAERGLSRLLTIKGGFGVTIEGVCASCAAGFHLV